VQRSFYRALGKIRLPTGRAEEGREKQEKANVNSPFIGGKPQDSRLTGGGRKGKREKKKDEVFFSHCQKPAPVVHPKKKRRKEPDSALGEHPRAGASKVKTHRGKDAGCFHLLADCFRWGKRGGKEGEAFYDKRIKKKRTPGFEFLIKEKEGGGEARWCPQLPVRKKRPCLMRGRRGKEKRGANPCPSSRQTSTKKPKPERKRWRPRPHLEKHGGKRGGPASNL